MKTMLLDGGDLVIGPSADYQMITGAAKVQQDVTCAIVEPLGNDRFHPGWGSIISDFVGQPHDDYLRTQVLTEVNRVIGNYAAVQRDKVDAQTLSGTTTTYSTDEIVAAVTGVSLVPTYDRLNVKINIGMISGATATISEDLG